MFQFPAVVVKLRNKLSYKARHTLRNLLPLYINLEKFPPSGSENFLSQPQSSVHLFFFVHTKNVQNGTATAFQGADCVGDAAGNKNLSGLR